MDKLLSRLSAWSNSTNKAWFCAWCISRRRLSSYHRRSAPRSNHQCFAQRSRNRFFKSSNCRREDYSVQLRHQYWLSNGDQWTSDAMLCGNSAPRNGTSRFRQFRFTERVSLQARGDFFNILNHPNFGSPINYLSSPQFGEATQMLNTSLGSGGQSGGLNPLYQIGGPSSIQLALKLQL